MTDYQPDWWDFLDEYDTEVTNADKPVDTGSNDSGSDRFGRDSLTFEISCDTTLTSQAIRDATAKMRDMQVLPFYDETGLPYYLFDDGGVIDARLCCDGDMIQLCDGERFYVSKILTDTANKSAHSFDQLASAFCQARQAGKSGMMDAMIRNLKEGRLYVSDSQKDLIEDMKGLKRDQKLTLEIHPSYDNWIDKEFEKTLYYTPCQGNQIALYDGENWSVNDFQDLHPDGFLRQDPISGCYHAILDPSMAHALINDPGEEQHDGSFKPWGEGLTGEMSRGQIGVWTSGMSVYQSIAAQKPPTTSFKTEVIHYEDYDGEIQWSIVTVNHPEIDWDPARPLPMDAEWAAKPSSVISGFTWTMLAPTNSFLMAHSTQDCVEWAVRLVYTMLYPNELLTGAVSIGSDQYHKLSAIMDLLNENLTVLHTTNVRLKPSSDACFIW